MCKYRFDHLQKELAKACNLTKDDEDKAEEIFSSLARVFELPLAREEAYEKVLEIVKGVDPLVLSYVILSVIENGLELKKTLEDLAYHSPHTNVH